MTKETGAGGQPFGEMVRLMMATQERNLGLAQAWSDSLLELVREQAEGNRAVLAALAASLAAMERALVSQEATNHALRQSLDANREVVERASAAQEHSLQLVQTALDNFAAVSRGQLDVARALLTPPGAAGEPLADLFQQWNDAVRRLFDASRPPDA
jgi:hypothetical protein